MHLLADTLFCVFAPLHAGLDIVPDDKTAGAAFHRDIVGEELDFFAALRAFLDREGRGAEVRGTRAMIQHTSTSPSFIMEVRAGGDAWLDNFPC